jgi:HSP20 family protein
MVEVHADLPGIPKENVKIEARDNVLILSGETKGEGERKEGTTHIKERFSGSFTRTIPLPLSADLEHVQAKFDNGVLTVNVPKKEEKGGRRITIQ